MRQQGFKISIEAELSTERLDWCVHGQDENKMLMCNHSQSVQWTDEIATFKFKIEVRDYIIIRWQRAWRC